MAAKFRGRADDRLPIGQEEIGNAHSPVARQCSVHHTLVFLVAYHLPPHSSRCINFIGFNKISSHINFGLIRLFSFIKSGPRALYWGWAQTLIHPVWHPRLCNFDSKSSSRFDETRTSLFLAQTLNMNRIGLICWIMNISTIDVWKVDSLHSKTSRPKIGPHHFCM
jgi:hypothetical protein